MNLFAVVVVVVVLLLLLLLLLLLNCFVGICRYSVFDDLLLGLGHWVQGFQCFPWLAVNFFLKDGLNVDSSKLQILLDSANRPMVGKPLYGLVSD
ncbi:hypothetical protein S83_036595 [Arachis hypogaea]